MTALLAGSTLLWVTGCPFGNSRTTNQGGGTVITAAGKVVGGQMTTLTPDEIQIVSDAISDLSPNVSLFIGDDEAAVAVDFLRANDLNSIEDIAAFAEEVANDPNGVVIPESLIQLIESGVNLDSLVSVTGDGFGSDGNVAPASQP
jgi:hypothetical protein